MVAKPPSDDRVVLVEGLSKSFHGHLGIGTTVAVDGLDLDVRRGEVFGLLGPNGAGKTTTLKMMLGLLRPDRGSVRLLGRACDDPAARARLGFLPENPYFYDYLTAFEFLDFYARLQGLVSSERADRVNGALERVGLADRGKIALRKFSKGMIQRVGLAQAIQHDPDLLILDEPMSGLDPIGRREVRDLILSLRDEGKTVLFSSHILQDAELLCDRVAILRGGKLRWCGELDGIGTGNIRWFEVSLQRAAPNGFPGLSVATAGVGELRRVEDVRELTELLTAAREADVPVVSVWPRRETLEDLFLREIGGRSGGDA